MDTVEDLADFRNSLRKSLGEIEDHIHALRYDAPTRGGWWERLEQLTAELESMAKMCRDVKG